MTLKGIKRSKENIMKISGKNNHNYEKPVPQEVRDKISKSLKGKMAGENNPMYGKCGKDSPVYGRKHTEEEKRKMSISITKSHEFRDLTGENNPMFGIPRDEETKEKIRKTNKERGVSVGPNNPNWKGGISCEPYCYIWSFDEFRQMIKDRDNNMCQNPMCGKPDSNLVIHHINYVKKDCEPSNLITLCISCNTRANGNRKITREDWQRFYTNLMIYKLN